MTQRRLILLLVLFFLALALPTSILVYQAYGQLKWEAFHQHQQLARELNLRIDGSFRELIEREEIRPISDYEFLNVTGAEGAAFLQRSPLSEFPLAAEIPGLIGYFQVDASGQLRTPIVPGDNPSNYGISSAELEQRKYQEDRIRSILGQNRLVGKSDPAAAPALPDKVLAEEEAAEQRADSNGLVAEINSLSSPLEMDSRDNQEQTGFDYLTKRNLDTPAEIRTTNDQIEGLKLEDSYEVADATEPEDKRLKAKQQLAAKQSRKEKVNLPQVQNAAKSALVDDRLTAGEQLVKQQTIRIQTFEGEVEPLEFALLDSGHFVLFRRVWHLNERFIQGILIDQADFFERFIARAFRESSLSSMSKLIVAYKESILQNYAAEYTRQYRPDSGHAADELLYQSRLIAPFSEIELIYTLARLPVSAGGQVIIWSALVLAIVLVVGCLMLLRLGQRQLALARQQQDFVSAVSHELKTPLTSIRMYGEILREDWIDEDKRKTYYDFIFHEAERLTRLINNVLQLARMSRNDQAGNLAVMTVKEALAELKPRLQSQLEPSGFALVINADATADAAHIKIDIDWFIQIFINLVDNAVKFSAKGTARNIDMRYQRTQDGKVEFSVRDYGPGIDPDQMKKIFKLFYRAENELTRETAGTGIGLALVQQLASAMQAEVDVINCDPGAVFRIQFIIEPSNGGQ